jgi:hypothetical protein
LLLIPGTPAAEEVNLLAPAMRALWTARALLITGQRRAMTWRFDMVPPPGLKLGRVAVARVRRAVGEMRLRNGHIARDCWRRDSMATAASEQRLVEAGIGFGGDEREGRYQGKKLNWEGRR